MKIKLIGVIGIIALAFGIAACGERQQQHHHASGEGHHHKAMATQTKVVVVEGIQVSFDLMGMEHHQKMMKSMNMKMSHHEGATHGLMATVMDKESKTVIKDASVAFAITGPDGQKVNQKGEVMAGGGMHHYGTHFKAGKGKYHISAAVLTKGKTISAEAEFEL